MKKTIVTALIAMSVFGGGAAVSAADSSAMLFVNGGPLGADAIIRNGVTFVPFRALFETLGMEVAYDAKLNQVTGTGSDRTLTFTLGIKTVIVNGEKKALHAAPFLRNGTTYIPARVVGEETGNSVFWTQEANLVQINSPDFIGASHTIDGIHIVMTPDGAVHIGRTADLWLESVAGLAEVEAIKNATKEFDDYRIVGDPPTEEQSKDPGYNGYPDYFDSNYAAAVKENRPHLPPLMSEGWISLPMLSEIEQVNRVSNANPDTITLARASGMFGVFRYDIVMTEDYKTVTDGDFVLNDVKVKKYYGQMYLNIEDLKEVGVIES